MGPSHAQGGRGCRNERAGGGGVLNGYSRAAGQTGKLKKKKKKGASKGNKWSRERGLRLMANVLRNRRRPSLQKQYFQLIRFFSCIIGMNRAFTSSSSSSLKFITGESEETVVE